MALPEPSFYNPPKPTEEAPQGDKPLSDGERLAQRIAIKQAFLSSLGVEWEPDDEDVQREMQFLPKDGSIVEMPDFEMPPLPEKEERAEETSSFQFTPEDDVDDPLSEEDIEDLKAARAARAAKKQQMIAGNGLTNRLSTPAPSPLQPPVVNPNPTTPLIPQETLGGDAGASV